MIELKLPLHYVEFLLSYLDEETYKKVAEVEQLRKEIYAQTYLKGD